jgi:uncharacterized protein with FMN-binding domain
MKIKTPKKSLILMSIFQCCIIFLLLSCTLATKIGKPIDKSLKDGVYEGIYRGGPNSARVMVTIENNKIADIELKSHAAWMGKKAEEIILERIIEQQTTDVDVVSGATNSSIVIMNAVQEAVEKSYRN